LHRTIETGTHDGLMRLLDRYVRWLVRHPWIVLVAVTVVTAVVASGLRHLHTEFNVESSLPANHPFVRIDRTIRKEFGGRRTLMLGIVPRTGDVWQPAVLATVRDVTLAALSLADVIPQNVVSLAAPSVRHVEDRNGSIETDYLMRDVPQTPEDIARLRANVESDPQLRGMLVTPDQRAALVVVDFFEGPESHELAQRVLDMADQFRDRPVDIWVAGEPMIALTDLGQSAFIGTRMPFVFLVISLMLLGSFRNVQGMVIPMLTAMLSTVWALGLMGHFGIPIDSWNAMVPVLLVAIAAAHSAQMLKRYVEEVARTGDNRAAVIESTVKMGPVMIAAGLTATLGFASLALFGVRAVANLGLSCAYGIASAVLLEMTFIPALRTILPAPRRTAHGGGWTARILASIQRAILRRRGRSVLIATAVALAVAAVGMTRIRTFGPTREYMPEDSLARRHLEALEQHFPGTVTLNVLYQGEPGSTKSLPVLQHMAALQAELQRDPLVVRTASVADLVKTLHEVFNAEDPTPYRLPDTQELTSQLLFLGDSPAFERFVDRSQSRSVVTAYLSSDDSALVGPLVRHLEQWVSDHPPPEGEQVLVAGGAGPTVLAVNEHTTYGKLLNMVVVLTVIWLVSAVIMRSAAVGLYVVTPIVVTMLLLFGGLGWTGTKLDMGSASVIAMSAGIGADYAIYFLFRLREEYQRLRDDSAAVGAALQTSGRAVLFVAASIAAGFACMGWSPYLGLELFGTLMPAAMVLSCLASLSLMPTLVLRLRPRFIYGEEPAPDRALGAPA
jgi:predicted RND superfamily exporter protein